MIARARLRAGLIIAAIGLAPRATWAGQCPSATVAVDNDVAGSGYSEVHPENFQSHDVDACAGTYRYLSQYVGDGSTDGMVTWAPTISIEGLYRVTTSFRASENRTDDADYTLFGDDGQEATVVVDQRGDGCTKVELGEIWCVPGGTCRLELDGTDDMKSDAVDETVFELVDCEPPPPSPCDPLVDAGFEVCVVSATSCEGVYARGEGCIAFCATVGMECVARFGGEPGCQKEDVVIPCDEINDHASDYCVCEGESVATSTGAAAEDTTTGAPGAESTGPSTSSSASPATEDSGTDVLPGDVDRGAASGCGCSAPFDRTHLLGLVVLVFVRRRHGRRHVGANHTSS